MRALRPALALFLVPLAACGGGSGGAPAPAVSSGQSLVSGLISNNTSDSAEPVELEGLDLQFSDDPHAFDTLLQ